MPESASERTARVRAEERWERISRWPFLVLSLVFIVAYSIRCLDTNLAQENVRTIWTVLLIIWAAFIIDYVVRLLLARGKWAFVRHNMPDLLAALLPIFRPFRLLRELRRIPFFRRHSGAAVRARVIAYVASFVVLWIYIISISELQAERGAPGATILSFGDSLYWAVVTIATVGYGDMVPVTTLGRVLAVLLMISGIAIIGVTTATVVSYVNEAVSRARQGGAHESPNDDPGLLEAPSVDDPSSSDSE
ncbi:MAG: potassium channel family protein [Humibacter sp.]